jgi:CHAD domain-containing protein
LTKQVESDSSPSPDSPAAEVLHEHLATQVPAIAELEAAVRQDEPDAVHQMRVASRRLRSALVTFRPLFNRDVTDRIREELRWLARVLGEARDIEVTRERLGSLVDCEPSEMAAAESSSHLQRVLLDSHDEARQRLEAAMTSDRYRQLVDDLTALLDDPPWTPRAKKPSRSVLLKRVRRDCKRLRKRMKRADDVPPDLRADALHDVRKAAKRVRYASEALAPAFDGAAARLAERAKNVQTVLGEYQDCMVSQQLLQDLARRPDLDQSHALLYGRLHALEQAQVAEIERRYEKTRKEATRKRDRRWLKP